MSNSLQTGQDFAFNRSLSARESRDKHLLLFAYYMTGEDNDKKTWENRTSQHAWAVSRWLILFRSDLLLYMKKDQETQGRVLYRWREGRNTAGGLGGTAPKPS